MFVGRPEVHPVRRDGILAGHPVRRDKMRLTVMFDIAQFFKLRLGKQIYDSTICRSSMILPFDWKMTWFCVGETPQDIC